MSYVTKQMLDLSFEILKESDNYHNKKKLLSMYDALERGCPVSLDKLRDIIGYEDELRWVHD